MSLASRQTLIINFKLFSGFFKKRLAKKTPTLACLSVNLNNHTPDDQQPVDSQHLTERGTPPTKSDKLPDPTIATLGNLPSEADQSNAITAAEPTLGTATADAGISPTGAAQSNATSPVETTAPPANANGGRPQPEADPSQVRRVQTQDVCTPKRAAQLEHTSTTPCVPGSSEPSSCAPAGGDTPQAPVANSSPKSSKKKRKKKSDNHVSIRCTDDLNDIITRRMERTGESQSEAVRAIIRESEDKAGNVYLSPKTPPEWLEKLLGEIKKWRTAFATAKSRLNVTTPADDDTRYTEVVEWRAESARLLVKIPKLEEAIEVALDSLSSLTPRKVLRLRNGIKILEHWETTFRAKKDTRTADLLLHIIDMLADAGITKP